MNAAARTLHHGNFFRGDLSTLTLSRKNVSLWLMLIAILLSAFSIVYLRNVERHYFGEQQSLISQNNRIEEQWSQLLLEQSMWSSPSRVQTYAVNHLNMRVTKPEAILIIEGNGK